MEQAGDVGGGEHFGPSALMIRKAVETHTDGDRFFFDGEDAAKAATLVPAGEVDPFEFRNLIEELGRWIGPGGVAGFAGGAKA
jgi:hypothetical protein